MKFELITDFHIKLKFRKLKSGFSKGFINKK